MLDFHQAHYMGAGSKLSAIDFRRITPQSLRNAIAHFSERELDRLETDIEVYEISGSTTSTLLGVLSYAAEPDAASL